MEHGGVKLDAIGSWSRDKLGMLEKYLAAYVNILSTERGKKFCSDFHYIDAFAGASEHIDKETGEYIDGSPRIALKITPPFSSYTFIENNRNKVKNILEPLAGEFSGRTVNVLYGDCNEIILQDILPQFPPRKGPSMLGFVFLDPYGTNLKWKTVEALGNASVFDVFINLSVMGVTRQAPDMPPPPEVCDRISQFMGGDEWFDVCYKKDSQFTLPGLSTPPLIRARQGVANALADCYKKKLQGCFAHVTMHKMMYSLKNSPLYALIFASQARTAMEKMRAILTGRKH